MGISSTDRKNSRGYDVHDLCVNADEAVVIRKIFDYYICGYGGRKIASELTASGIFNRQVQQKVLNRGQLTGVMCRGDSHSAIIPDLQIISPEAFQKAQEITVLRKQHQISQKSYLSMRWDVNHSGGYFEKLLENGGFAGQ